MSTTLTSQNHSNSEAKTSQFSPGASGVNLCRVMACLDLATVVAMPIYMQVLDRASSPSGGETPIMSIPFDAAGFAAVDYGMGGRKFTNAAYFVLSTTPHTYTWAGKVGGGNLEALFDAQF